MRESFPGKPGVEGVVVAVRGGAGGGGGEGRRRWFLRPEIVEPGHVVVTILVDVEIRRRRPRWRRRFRGRALDRTLTGTGEGFLCSGGSFEGGDGRADKGRTSRERRDILRGAGAGPEGVVLSHFGSKNFGSCGGCDSDGSTETGGASPKAGASGDARRPREVVVRHGAAAVGGEGDSINSYVEVYGIVLGDNLAESMVLRGHPCPELLNPSTTPSAQRMGERVGE